MKGLGRLAGPLGIRVVYTYTYTYICIYRYIDLTYVYRQVYVNLTHTVT